MTSRRRGQLSRSFHRVRDGGDRRRMVPAAIITTASLTRYKQDALTCREVGALAELGSREKAANE